MNRPYEGSSCEQADAFAILTRQGIVLLSGDCVITQQEDSYLYQLNQKFIERKMTIEGANMNWEKIKHPWCRPSECGTCKLNGCIELFKEFIQFFGFNEMSFIGEVGSFEQLLYGKRSYNRGKLWYEFEKVPDHDHARLYKIKGTSRIVYVHHPYEFDRDKLEKWCNERNLIYVVCDRKYSFYQSGQTEMIMIMSNDTYIDFLNIPGFPARWEEQP